MIGIEKVEKLGKASLEMPKINVIPVYTVGSNKFGSNAQSIGSHLQVYTIQK